jgi:hypothetical protein
MEDMKHIVMNPAPKGVSFISLFTKHGHRIRVYPPLADSNNSKSTKYPIISTALSFTHGILDRRVNAPIAATRRSGMVWPWSDLDRETQIDTDSLRIDSDKILDERRRVNYLASPKEKILAILVTDFRRQANGVGSAQARSSNACPQGGNFGDFEFAYVWMDQSESEMCATD